MGGLASPKAKWHGMKWQDILPGNYDGAAHLKDMDLDGIDAVVVYPLASAATYAMEDRDLALACVRAYNDWMVEDFCSVDPSRLLPMCLVPVDDPMDKVLEEVERTAQKGAREFFLPYFAARPYWDPYYDPLWKLASEAGCPVTIHREHGGKRGTQEGNRGYQGALLPDSGAAKDSLWVSATVQRFFSVMGPLTDMIFTGVFDRFPGLKIINGESNFGWVPFWRQTMDEEWDRHQQTQWTRVQAEQPPSSYLGRNVFVTILDDKVGFDLARTDRSLQEDGHVLQRLSAQRDHLASQPEGHRRIDGGHGRISQARHSGRQRHPCVQPGRHGHHLADHSTNRGRENEQGSGGSRRPVELLEHSSRSR